MPMSKKLAAEFIGTFWLVLGGCGSAVLAAAFPEVGIGLAGVSLAFGLTVLTMAYAIGHIFIQHFEAGGTLLTFQPAKMKTYFDELYTNGREVANSMMKGKKVGEPVAM